MFGGVDDPNGENDEVKVWLVALFVLSRGSVEPDCGARPNPVDGGGEKKRGGDAAY